MKISWTVFSPFFSPVSSGSRVCNGNFVVAKSEFVCIIRDFLMHKTRIRVFEFEFYTFILLILYIYTVDVSFPVFVVIFSRLLL